MEFGLGQVQLEPPAYCLVCFSKINETVYSKEIKLNELSNVLRLSPTIYQGINIEELPGQLYCSTCTETILNALDILHEIKNLENSLTVVTSKLKRDLIQGYNERKVDENVEETFDLSSTSDVAMNLIRKTFVQCWSECQVKLPKLTEESSTSNHPEYRSFHYITTMPQLVETWQEDDFPSLEDDNSSSVPGIVNSDSNENLTVKSRRKRKPAHRFVHDSDAGNEFPVDDPEYEVTTKKYAKKRKTTSLGTSKPKKVKVENIKSIDKEQNPSEGDDPENDWYADGSNQKAKKAVPKNIGVKLKCNLCEKTFMTEAALTTHVANIHDKTYKFFCHICGQGFQVNSMLQRHITYVHTTEKNFECDVCHKRFKRSHQLFYHKRVHTGERLICHICGRGFMQPEKLKLHLVIHTGEKQHKCPFCNKFFAVKQYVTNHIKDTHEGKRKGRNRKPTVREMDEMSAKSYINIQCETLEDSPACEIEITQESQEENETKFCGENFVIKFISGM